MRLLARTTKPMSPTAKVSPLQFCDDPAWRSPIFEVAVIRTTIERYGISVRGPHPGVTGQIRCVAAIISHPYEQQQRTEQNHLFHDRRRKDAREEGDPQGHLPFLFL